MAKHVQNAPKISWHRGGAEVAPHATRAAFLHALRSKAECVEIDVREMADGTLVCVHDAKLDGIGLLRDLAYGDLNQQQRSAIYTLAAFIEDLVVEDPLGRTMVHFDLKETGHELRAIDLLLSAQRPLFVTTLEKSSVILLRSERPQVMTLLTIGSLSSSTNRWRRFLHRSGELFPFGALHATGASGIAVHVHLAKSWTLQWCKKRNLMVVVWTIDGTTNLERWLQSDVDAVTTNRPMKALQIRNRLSEQ